MATKDFIPSIDAELSQWLTDFSAKLPTFQVELGLTPTQISDAQASCANLIGAITAVSNAKNAFNSAVQAKKTSRTTEVGLLRKLIGDFKRAAGYTPAIGAALKVIGEGVPFDPNTYKPVISGSAFPGYVEVKFTKLGVDGVNIYARLKGQTVWGKLAFDSASPYIDNRSIQPNTPETREYSAIGVIDDEEIGLRSDIIEIVFGG